MVSVLPIKICPLVSVEPPEEESPEDEPPEEEPDPEPLFTVPLGVVMLEPFVVNTTVPF